MTHIAQCLPLIEVVEIGFPCDHDTLEAILSRCPLLREVSLATNIRGSDIQRMRKKSRRSNVAIIWCNLFHLDTHEPEQAPVQSAAIDASTLDALDDILLSKMPKLQFIGCKNYGYFTHPVHRMEPWEESLLEA